MQDDMTRHRRSLGEQGEEIAADYVRSLGWRVLERNWRCPDGELDIVAHDPTAQCLVAVEVKTRTTAHFGRPVEAVDDAKIGRLHHLVRRWLWEQDLYSALIRVDLVGVVLSDGSVADLEHVRDVV